MNDPLTDEDADTIVLAAELSGQHIFVVAQVFFMELPEEHSALYSYMARWEFTHKLEAAQKRYNEEQNNT